MKIIKNIGRTMRRARGRFLKRKRNHGICALSALLATWCINVTAADAVRLPIVSATASADDGNVAANALDGSLTTRWSAQGDGQWILLDLGKAVGIGSAKIAWHQGNQRIARFDIQTSGDASNWTTVYTGASSGTTLALESCDVTDSVARYVRIVGHGNSASVWNSITEVEVDGTGGTTTPPPPPPPPPPGETPLALASVTASSADGANVAANTLDKNPATRWSALGDGQWISYDLGARATITSTKIAWYKGDQRSTRFDVQTSEDGNNWAGVFSGAGSGSNLGLETYALSSSTGRYVRVVGHGSTGSLWNSIKELEIQGTPADGSVPPPPPPPPPTNPPPTLPTIGKVYARLTIGNGKMPYYRNRPIDVADPRVTRAIIVIHGAGGNASAYFDRINNIIPSSLHDNVMVIAPYFQDPSAAKSGDFWWDGDWREGGDSGGISSYAVLDKFVETVRNGNFPNLKWVVICGHSAGGQTTQRYAAFTDIDLKTTPNSALVKFVPANPSSYVYLNEYRNPEGDGTWVIPAQDCSSGDGYNEWKYGLTGLYGYTAARGADFARTHLQACKVELLAGTADTYDNGDLDLDCGAEWQGPFRYQRAHIFKMFMDKYYPANHFGITDVPGVDHDSTAMFASPQGMNALFFAD
jgi:pimeloyl-ACP methyl ester carboxylesterase